MNTEYLIKKVELSGTAEERGFAYGESCADLISKNISFYKDLIKLSPESLREHAIRFSEITKAYNPDLKTEMDAIAKGANVDPVEVYMINARTELLALSGVVHSECSTFFFPKTNILFENWDWLENSKDLTVMLYITLENGNKILTFTEAGMVGKIGISSRGFGIAFNYLFPEPNEGGLPVHILLRTLLESDSYESALLELSKEHIGTSGNIMLASSDSKSVDAELTGKKTYVISGNNEPLYHTNHYMAGAENNPDKAGYGFLDNSFERVNRINELLSGVNEQTVEDAKKTLFDRKDGRGMICRDFLVEDPGDGRTGTIASVIMDLNSKEIHVCLNPQNNSTYETFSI